MAIVRAGSFTFTNVTLLGKVKEILYSFTFYKNRFFWHINALNDNLFEKNRYL